MQQKHAAGAAIIDTRDDVEYAQGHVRGSLNVGLGGRFAEYCGDVVDPHTPIVLIGNPGTETEARVRLGRIGFDHVVGALVGGCAAFVEHPEAIEVSSRLTASELGARGTAELQVVDVRNPGETRLGMIPGAAAIPLAQLTRRLSELDPTRPTVVHCAGGYRSSLAASALRAAGFADVSDLLGGFEAWVAAAQPVVQTD
jgi:hydroxyacylglutathione hydrolase